MEMAHRREKEYKNLDELLADAEKAKQSKLTSKEIEQLTRAFDELKMSEKELELAQRELEAESSSKKIDPDLEEKAKEIIENISKETIKSPLTPEQLYENRKERFRISKRLAALGHKVNFSPEELEEFGEDSSD